MEEGCGFGELALINNDKRSASIVAITACEVYKLPAMAFK
jgi:CRP-like cAMP-binding protein